MNTYQATLKIGSGLQKVELQANSLYHAQQMFYKLYGRENIMNVHQV